MGSRRNLGCTPIATGSSRSRRPGRALAVNRSLPRRCRIKDPNQVQSGCTFVVLQIPQYVDEPSGSASATSIDCQPVSPSIALKSCSICIQAFDRLRVLILASSTLRLPGAFRFKNVACIASRASTFSKQKRVYLHDIPVNGMP